MDTGTAWALGSMVAAFILGFLNLWDKTRDAKTAAVEASAKASTAEINHSVLETRITGHDVALNGGLTERVVGIVAHQLLLAGIITPVAPPVVPAPPEGPEGAATAVAVAVAPAPDGTGAQIAALRARIAALGGDHAA